MSETVILGEAQTPADTRLYGIGDIHGCLDELNHLHQLILDDMAAHPVAEHKIIFLGDYVDRGPDSKGVIDFLVELISANPNVVCLKGNHEDKLIEFLADPVELAHSFLHYGGVQLAASYGVKAPPIESPEPEMRAFCAALSNAIPAHHINFINKLPTAFESGDFGFVHAGIRPGILFSEQTDRDRMWIRADFLDQEAPLEKVIVHGHTPHYAPEVKPNRINVDTMAFDTGRITAVVLEGRDYRFLDTA